MFRLLGVYNFGLGLKSPWLKSLGLEGPGLKLGVEMSFNLSNVKHDVFCKDHLIFHN